MTDLSLVYYFTAFIASLALSGLYTFIWHRHFDVHITLVFVLVPVVNLGFVLLSRAQSLEAALTANKIAYLGGCFLQLMILLAVFSLCDLRLNKGIKTVLALLSTGMYFAALTQGDKPWFYASVAFETVNGRGVFLRESGPLHLAFKGMVIAWFAMSLGAIIYSFLKKNQVSRKILLLLFLPEIVAIFCYFGGRMAELQADLMPAAYVLAQVMYLLIVHRIGLYEVTDTAVDTLVQNGSTGFVMLDDKYHYLGSNQTAKNVFPQLRELTVDLSLKRNKTLWDLLLPRLKAYEADPTQDRFHHEQGDTIYLTEVTPLYNGKKKKGFELVITDDTNDQQLIRLRENQKAELEKEVEKKTEHIREMHDQLIMGMATMVESRDNSTGGHIRRTSEGVRLLLQALDQEPGWDCSSPFCKALIKAAPMHDLGKIAVDDDILRKPGRFTPEEYDAMKRHAPEGARIVREILKNTDDETFKVIAENVAHYHHERWDGRGYPEGLAGEAIPLEARVMAVADVYDALVSKRVYKEELPFDRANEIIEEGMGTQFDPALRDAYERARPALEAYYQQVSAAG